MRNRTIKFALATLLLCISGFVYLYNIHNSFNLEGDFSRDIVDMFYITKGDLSLIGPKSSFGGLYTGPFYYYLFAPFLRIFNLNIYSLLYVNALLFAGAIVYFYYSFTKKFGIYKSFFASFVLMLLPVVHFAARYPGNAYSYIPFLIIYLAYVLITEKFFKLNLLVLGLAGGILSTVHFSNGISVISIFLLIAYQTNKKRNLIYFLLGFILAFTPLFLFEIKHDFVMFKNTFIHGMNTSTGTFFTNKINLIESINIVSNLFVHQLKSSGLFLLVLSAIAVLINKNRRNTVVLLVSLISYLLVSLVFTKIRHVDFYIFSVSVVIFINMLYLILQTRLWLLVVLFLAYLLLLFPKNYYGTAPRRISTFSNAVAKAIDVTGVSKKDQFSVMQIRKGVAITPYGFEYFFFFLKKGYSPNRDYKLSKYLLVFSEDKNVTPEKINNWEYDEFKQNKTLQYEKYDLKNLLLYKISH